MRFIVLTAAVLLSSSSSFAGAPILTAGAKPTLSVVPQGSANPPGDLVNTILNGIVTDGTLLDDFEDGNNVSKWGGTWFTINDVPNGGLSTVTPPPGAFAVTAGGYNNSAYCAKINVTLAKGLLGYNPFCGLGVELYLNTLVPADVDLTKATGFRYWYKGGKHIIKFETSDIGPGASFQVAVPASAGWTQAVFTWDSFKQPGSAVAITDATKTHGRKFTWIIQDVDGYVDSLFVDNVEVPGYTDRGIAVTGVDNANGSWQSSIDGGTNWTFLNAASSDASATVLNTDARLRFLPTGAFTGSSTFSFRAWNQSDNPAKISGTAGVDVSVNGGVTPYSAAKDTAQVSVQSTGPSAPTIYAQPQSQSKVVGQSVTFSVGANGNPTPTYQWRKNNGAITGATGSSYTIPSVVMGDSGSYDVVVTNSQGSVPSTAAKLTVTAAPVAPSISVNPQSQSKAVSQPVTFSVTASGVPTPTYQWRKNGGAITGATGSSYTIPSVVMGDSGSYDVVVTNSQGSVTSTAAKLTVNTAPVAPSISVNPQSQRKTVGESVTFNVTAAGVPDPTYQWRKNGTAITGATGTSYTISPVGAVDRGSYDVVVTNTQGVVTSNPAAVLTVCASHMISQQPINQGAIAGDSVTFSLQVDLDVVNPTLRWQRSPDGAAWTDATGAGAATPSYAFQVQAGDNGAKLRCVVSYVCGAETSFVVTLSVCSPATVTMDPKDTANVIVNTQASFTALGTGSGTITYQWQDSAANHGWDVPITGATSSKYSFIATADDNGRKYKCLVSNGCGGVFSKAATLGVCTPLKVFNDLPATMDKVIGDTVKLKISVLGSNPKYQWQKLVGGTWTSITGATDTGYSFPAKATDDSTSYRCGYSNECTSLYSTALVLRVCTPVSIAANPKDTTVLANTSATFRALGAGTNVTYQWQRSTDITATVFQDIVGATQPQYTFTADSSYNGIKFQCLVSGKCGTRLTSYAAKLSVCVPVSINIQPSNRSVIAGQGLQAVFTVGAKGTGLGYQWQRKNVKDTAFSLVPSATSNTYSLTPTAATQKADSGASFRCVVTGSCGSATSTNGVLLVYLPIVASFGVDSTSGQVPLTVHFTDSSTGSITTRIWDFGDNAKPDTGSKAPVHRYSTAGNFTVTLTVTGPGATGSVTAQKSIFTYNPGQDPIVMTGRYISPQNVEVVFSKYNNVQTSKLQRPYADSVGLWYRDNAYPTRPADGTHLKSYLVQDMKGHGETFTDTVTVPSTADSVGIINGIFWNGTGVVDSLLSGNGFMVLMKDTSKPSNDLVVTGAYIPDTTLRVSLANVSSLDPVKLDKVGVWYSLTGDVPDFSDPLLTRWLTVDQVKQGSSNDKYDCDIGNSRFNGSLDTAYCAVMVVSKNGRQSIVKNIAVPVGKAIPANPIRLSGQVKGPTTIQLSWNNVSTKGVQQILIWYRRDSPVPKQYNLMPLLGTEGLDTIRVHSAADTFVEWSKFSEKTHYYFGAQVSNGSMWSFVTDSSSWDTITPASGAKLDSNTITITGKQFDATTNTVRVSWRVNRIVSVEPLQVGILYSTDAYPLTAEGKEPQVFSAAADTGSAVIDISKNVKFNTAYYLTLWLRSTSSAWTDPVSGRSMDTVMTGTYTWQNVVLFLHYPDTVYAFNSNIRFTNGQQVDTLSYRVQYFMPDTSLYGGFLQASTVGFEFGKKESGLIPFDIGLKVDAGKIADSLLQYVRMYRWDSASGVWKVDTTSQYDAARGYVYVKTGDLGSPMAALVDMERPQVAVTSDTSSFVERGVSIQNTIVVKDNVGNATYRLLYGRGDEAYHADGKKAVQGTGETLSVVIPEGSVSGDNGVRALFEVGDGRFTTSVDLSRQVVRGPGVDYDNIKENVWVPLKATAVLDAPDVQKVLRVFGAGDGSWSYDNTKFRVFRWRNGWVEYSEANRGVFEFTPGSLVWIKTTDQQRVDYGTGRTLSLRQASRDIRLLPGDWTDFVLPFKFDVMVGDIIRTTDSLTGKNGDTLEFYEWVKVLIPGKQDSQYVSMPRYIRGIPVDTLNNLGSALEWTKSGFAVYNPTPDTIMLCVPAIPTALSKIGMAKSAKKQSVGGWAVAVAARTEESGVLSPVYCGYTKEGGRGVSYYPVSPSFTEAYVGVMDAGTKRVWGHAVTHAMKDGGCAYLLAFCNGSTSPTRISYHLENVGKLPGSMGSGIYNAEAGKYEDMSGGWAVLSVGAKSKEYRWLLVGSAEYLAKAGVLAPWAKLAFAGTYPNPFNRYVHIRYSLPYDGVNGVKFAVYDMRGKRVWQREIRDIRRYGMCETVWDGRQADGRSIASGVYIIRMTAMDNQNRSSVFEQKMTFMP
jgi:PKD repeat protein